MRKSIIWVCIVVVFLSSCSNFDIEKDISIDPAEDAIHIGFSIGDLREERWIRDRDSFQKAAEDAGAIVTILSANGNSEVQVEQVESLILQQVDVLVIVPHDADLFTDVLNQAKENNIPVISYDRLIRNANVDYYISFDNKKVGEIQAQSILEVKDKGKFAYIGGALTDNNALLLKEGSMSILKEKLDSKEIELVVNEHADDWSPESAYTILKTYLENNNAEIDAVICANDGTANGAIRALEEYGLAGKIPVSGQDAELAACRLIAQGKQTSTVFKSIDLISQEAAKLAVSIGKDEEVEANDYIQNGQSKVPSILLTPIKVTKDNLDEIIINSGFHSYTDIYD